MYSLNKTVMIILVEAFAINNEKISKEVTKVLGEKKFEQANKVANNGVFLAVLSYIAFCIM